MMGVLGPIDWQELQIENIWRDEKRKISPCFLHAVDHSITQWLLHRFKWSSIPKEVHINSYVHAITIGKQSSCSLSIWAGKWNDTIKICWQSKSGKIYQPHDEPDPNDFECWISSLDEARFLRALYGPTSLPFKLKNLSYALHIGAIDMSMTALLLPRHQQIEWLEKEVNEITASINQQSEAKGRNLGVVHNWHITQEGNALRIAFDMGSAGFTWLKKWLLALSHTNALEQVRLGRFK